jgi:hypothetical protein
MKGLRRSFAGGEIAPEMFGRLDLGKYQTGLELARNFETLAHGPAARRPGLFYVNEVKDSTHPVRLIPFVFSATQAIVLELGHFTCRFHNSSGTVLEANKAVTLLTPPNTLAVVAHGYSVGDGVFYAGGYYLVATTPTADSITLNNLDGTAATLSLSGTIARVYTIATPWSSADLGTLSFTQNTDVLTVVSQLYAAREIRRLGAANWTVTTVSFAPTLAAPTSVVATPTIPTPTNPTTQNYKVTSIAADGITESVASANAAASNNLNIAGNFNTVTWVAAPGAARYYVYKLRGGVYGYVGQTTGTSIIDDNILADTTTSPPDLSITLNTTPNDYPGTVTYLEQRRWFAATPAQPQNVWATRNATESNLTSSTPSRDDDALAFRIAAQQQNAIRFLVPLVDLIALTVGGEFRIFADGGAAITPGTLAIKPQSYAGCAQVQPVLTANSCLYVQSQGSRVRELSYDPNGLGVYKSIDASLFAPHLFNGKQIKELAYVRAPDQVLWAVRTDGTLLGMTYVPEQQVFGWHHHDTNGLFESCAVIPEGAEDVLYVVVNRTINGRTVRYVERRKSRLFVDQADAFYVDAGLTYSGVATTTVSGLRHLEGRSVQVLADGAVVDGRSVVNGALTPALDTPAAKITIGLQYLSDLQTLPAYFEQAAALGQGTMKNASKIFVRVTQSSLLKAGPSFTKLRDYPPRQVSDPYGSPPALRTGELALAIDPSWNTDGNVCIRQDQPVPLTVLSLTIDDAIGG